MAFEELVPIVRGLREHFDKFGIEFLIVGAKARDIMANFSNSEIRQSTRKTTDVDFGVFVDSWETLEKLTQSFIDDDAIVKSDTKENNIRFYYQGTPFDLVPFGGVANEKDQVSWKPAYDTIMTVTGYEEALNSAKEYQIGNEIVKVVTPEMLVALKLVAWGENKERTRDARDIAYILENYELLDDGLSEVYHYYEDFLEKLDTHHETLVAIMGSRIKVVAKEKHVELIHECLANKSFERFVQDMVEPTSLNQDQLKTKYRSYVSALIYGLSN
ncbi:nucleotidyl transferase AbiEii/AbiGii toxin family protein [Halobacteriovorax sp. RZ-1]|uniref:nucleotidyl transferase AbiEii/AbiGii toxin family protein n=1 Tax=unclassified Halobacteriovorax TaxID=2639665 RepID=UPI00371564F5